MNTSTTSFLPNSRAPTQALLLALLVIEATERSFGVDKAKAYDLLIQPLKDFMDGCVDKFNDL